MVVNRSTEAYATESAEGSLLRGDGPLIAVVPSLGRGVQDYGELLDLLAQKGFRGLAIAPRRFGAEDDTLTLHDLARDAAVEIERHARAAVVVGHGFGARVARVLATDRPDLVRAVVVLAATARRPVDPDVMASVRASADFSLPREQRLAHLRNAFFAPGSDASVWLDGWDHAAMEAQLRASQRTPVSSYLAAGSAPMLLLQPAQDRVAPLEHAHLLQAEFGGRVTLEVIPDAGHAAVPEQPQRIAEAIARYGRRLDEPPNNPSHHEA